MNTTKNTPKRLDWSPQSLRDRHEIWEYIAGYEKNPINAALVESRIARTAAYLEVFSLIGTPGRNSRRLLPVKDTQYTIHYRVLASSVRIMRVAHQKRKTPKA